MIERMRRAAVARLGRWLRARVAERRPPNLTIGGEADPYLRRWYLIPRNPIANVYLHQFLRSDDDRALHDHPWVNVSLLLDGHYVEIVGTRGGTTVARYREAGDVVARGPRAAHRVVLREGEAVWTLFVTGPRLRAWGFWCPAIGWVHQRDFLAGPRGETVGRGCDK